MRTTKLEININKFQNNINKIKEYCDNKELMPVIKANAYGTYINKRIDILKQFKIVAVAIVEEGIELRNNGYNGEIFILNQPSIEEIKDIEKYQLTIGLSSKEFLEECIKNNEKFKVHLEIETGMNRTGIKKEDLNTFLNELNKSNLIIEGVYTHLSSADVDRIYTNRQINTFKEALNIIKEKITNLKYIHIEASNGLLNYNVDFTNLIRPGLIIYGYEPFKNASELLKVEPIMELKTTITYIKECEKNDAISYSQKYICNNKKTIATIPIGYADGYRRNLSNKGYVFINNQKRRIVGNICMDSCMVDVTDTNSKVGDEVIIWDNNNIFLDEIASMCDTINYEIMCTISERVPRVFIGGKNERN